MDCPSPKGHIILGTHSPEDASSRGHFVQGTLHPGDASSRGRFIWGRIVRGRIVGDASSAYPLGTSFCNCCDMPMVPQSMHECQHSPSCFLRKRPKVQYVIHFPQPWQFAQSLCDHWHIAAVTAHAICQ
jgi:hypothetical protein